MRFVPLLVLFAALADPPAAPPTQMRLKDGTVYRLAQPPQLKDGRFVFKTTDGKVFSLAESEVEEIRPLSPTPTPRVAPNPQDSRALGAIARQERRRTGKRTLVAPKAAPRPRETPTP